MASIGSPVNLFVLLVFVAIALMAVSSLLMRASYHLALHESAKQQSGTTVRDSTDFFNNASAITFWIGLMVALLSIARLFAVVLPAS